MTQSSEPSTLPAIEIPPTPIDKPILTMERPRRPYLDLFLISFLILFFELACIRWFGSTVVFLTFFTNIVLLATFLGMSVGLLAAGRRQDFIRWVLPLSFLTITLAMISFNLYINYSDKIGINVGNQRSSPQFIYFGTEYVRTDPSKVKFVPLWAIAGAFFALIALMFIGLGQAMGRAFDAIPNRVLAYTADVVGSLTGIAVFAAISYRQLSPHFWFAPIVVILLYLVRRWTMPQIISALGIVFMIGLGAYNAGQVGKEIFWSPYYKIAYTAEVRDINTNNIGHQQMHKIEETGSAYSLVHLLNRDSGGTPFEDVMIIGAGSGNDVAAALRYGAKHIDAVEIDPVINWIGRDRHPDKPYDDNRVTIHLDDGRSFARKTKAKYDLAIYALVDSLVLQSGYTSLRLENFLFTEQALRDIKKTLKPGGVFAMYNYYRQGWVVGRLAVLAEKVFGTKPVVISLPYQKTISADDSQMDHITFLLMGTDAPALERIRKQFEDKTFWAEWHPSDNEGKNGFVPKNPDDDKRDPRDWPKRIDTSVVSTENIGPLPQDNWPQLYLRTKTIPWAPTGQGMVTVAVLSILILLIFAPVRTARPNGQMFFLGAGFMLLETKGVVHMALLFGSTWIVNSVVFFAILVMILFANLFVMAMKPKDLKIYYALLIIALLVNTFVPMDWFLSLDATARTITSCAVVFVPVFFAGVIFATAFSQSPRPDIDFGSNVAGIILGGLSEQLSLVIGFNYLLLVAIAYYLLSYVLKPRIALPGAAPSVP